MTQGSPRDRRSRIGDGDAGRIYGLLVVGATLAVTSPDNQSQWSIAADALVTAVVYGLAHLYAHLVQARVHLSRPLRREERLDIAAGELPIVLAMTVPFVALIGCWAVGTESATAVTVASWLIVTELAVTSWRAGVDTLPPSERLRYALASTALGLGLIGLKVATH